MFSEFKKQVKLNGSTFIALLVLEIFLINFFVIPFITENNLLVADMVGHYYLADYYKTTLWPRWTGWNPYLLGGFPQGQFYPSLFHWLAGGIGIFIGTELAFKLLLVLSIVLLPVSFAFFLSAVGLNDLARSLSLILFFVPLLYVNEAYAFSGIELPALFNLGTVSHFFSTFILFFYLGTLINSVRNLSKTKKMGYAATSILLAILILTHVFATVTALFSTVVVIIFYVIFHKENFVKLAKFTGLVFILSFALASFWLIPLLGKINFATPFAWSGGLLPVPFLFLFFLLAGLVAYKKMDEKIGFLIAFAIPFFIIFLIQDFIKILHLQLWRFSAYPNIFIAGAIGASIPFLIHEFEVKIKNKFISNNRYLFVFLFSILILLFLFPYIQKSDVQGKEQVSFSLPNNLYGRIISVDIDPSYLNPLRHVVPQLVAMGGNEDVSGLFIESTKNQVYLNLIKNEIGGIYTNAWGIFEKPIYPEDRFELLPYQFKYFGINYIFTNIDPIYFSRMFRDITYRYYDLNYTLGVHTLIHVDDTNSFEILGYMPLKVEGDWNDLQWQWFNDKEKIKTLITPDSLPISQISNRLLSDSYLSILEDSPEYKKLYLSSNENLPIYIKTPYFPNWHAYVNGKEVQIYRVPVNMMLVYGTGSIELIYQFEPIDLFGIFVSSISLAFLLVKYLVDQ